MNTGSKYRNRNNDLTISNDAAFEIEKIRGIITAYEGAMEEFSVPVRTQTDEEGREETVLQNNVLPNVYDDWSEDQDGNRTPVDRTAEYDKLLTRYIEDRTLYEHNLIDTGYNDYIIEVFTEAPASSPSGVQQQLPEEIASLAERISSLQDIYYETNDEYNEYLGAQNIMMLSSVRVTERFPILIFAVLIMVIFGALGCAGAALFGRIEDFIEFYAFTNKVDGLPNRAKCDQFIAAREKRPIPEDFSCVVLKLGNLQAENARLGREGGDRMLKDFVELLTAVFLPSEKLFVANNGAGQYLIFAEALRREQVDAALFQLRVLLFLPGGAKADCHPGPGPGPADGVAAYAAAGAGGAADRPLRRPNHDGRQLFVHRGDPLRPFPLPGGAPWNRHQGPGRPFCPCSALL